MIDNSRKAVYGYDQRLEVFGSAGMIAVPNRAPDAALLSDREGVHGPRPHSFFLDRYAESYLAEMQEFVECLLADREPSVSGADGRLAVVMAYAARMSYQQHRSVRLSEIGES